MRRRVIVSARMSELVKHIESHNLATAAMRRAIMEQGRERLLPPKYQKIFDEKYASTGGAGNKDQS